MNVSDFDSNMAPLKGSETVLQWHKVDQQPFRLSGFPWYAEDKVFRRLPRVPEEPFPNSVECLANCPAGGQCAFQSNTRQIAVRVKLAGAANMPHMPSTGQCGFDLYVGPAGEEKFHAVTKYDHSRADYEVLLFDHTEETTRSFTLNFPLYQGVESLQIGLTPESQILPPVPYPIPGRIVCYGTSITQGGCASRPGMAYTNILSRFLNAEFVNLGFSGSGKGEPEVCRAFARISDPRLFIIDYEANVDCEQLEITLPELVRALREQHPRAPILIVSRIAFANDITHVARRLGRDAGQEIQRHFVENARANGDPFVFFLDGSTLLGKDFEECTVDGIHPTDLGFLRMARGLEPVIRDILRRCS